MVKPEPAQSVVVPKMVVDTSKGGPPQFRLTKLFIDAYQTCPAAATKKCVPATTCGIYSGSKSDKLDCGLLYSPSGLLRFGPDPVSQNLVLAKINPENGNGEWLWDDWANRRDDFTRDTFNLTNLNPYTKTSVFLTSNGKLVHYDVEHGQPITDSFNNRFRHENPLKGTTIIQNTGVENGPFTLTLNDKLGAAFIKNKYGKTAWTSLDVIKPQACTNMSYTGTYPMDICNWCSDCNPPGNLYKTAGCTDPEHPINATCCGHGNFWYCGCKPGQVSAITYDPSDNVGNRCFDIAKETALLTSHLDQTGSSSFLALGLPEGVTQKEGMFITQEPYTHSYRNLKWTVTQEAPGVPDKNDIWIWTVGSSEYNSMMLFHRIRSVANPTLCIGMVESHSADFTSFFVETGELGPRLFLVKCDETDWNQFFYVGARGWKASHRFIFVPVGNFGIITAPNAKPGTPLVAGPWGDSHLWEKWLAFSIPDDYWVMNV